MSIGARLKQWRLYKHLKQDEASSLFGIPFSTYQKYEMDISKPGADAMEALYRAGINTNWLLTGEGEMLLNGSKAQEQQGHYHLRSLALEDEVSLEDSEQAYNDSLDIISDIPDDFVLMPVYDTQPPAGHANPEESGPQTGHLAFRRHWLRAKGLNVKDLAIITAQGDSMEPTISNGDIMLVDTSIDKIIDDALYIVQIDHHLIVKRIQQVPDGTLIIISDNSKYKEQIIGPEQAKGIKIAGQVKWYGHEI